MSRRFIRNINPNIKELVEEEQCGCGNRILPYLMKAAVAPCELTRVTGQTLVDPGLEQTSNQGPNGDEVPYRDFGRRLKWPSDNSFAWDIDDFAWPVPWSLFPNQSAGTTTYSTTNPRSGSQHIRSVFTAAITTKQYFFARQGNCSESGVGDFGVIVQTGDVIDASVYVAASVLTNSPTVALTIVCYESDGTTFVGGLAGSAVAATLGYTQYSHSFTAPAGSGFAVVSMTIDNKSTIRTWDIDDASLIVT